MREVERIADQLRRSLDGEAWHGPALGELLNGLTAERALARPLPGVRCVWELVLHAAAWQEEVGRYLQGQPFRTLPPEEDWPPVTDPSPAAWDAARQRLLDGGRRLADAIARLPDERLDEVVPGKKFRVYILLHGLVQHHIYHAGQIAVLKRQTAPAA